MGREKIQAKFVLFIQPNVKGVAQQINHKCEGKKRLEGKGKTDYGRESSGLPGIQTGTGRETEAGHNGGSNHQQETASGFKAAKKNTELFFTPLTACIEQNP